MDQYSNYLGLLEIPHFVDINSFAFTVNLFSPSMNGAVHQVSHCIFSPAKFKVIFLGNSYDRC